MKKDYKILVGIIMGIIISATGVYAATTYASSTVYYDKTNSSLSSDDVQNAIDELAVKFSNLGNECPDGYYCIELKDTLALGDYVSLTPTLSSYTTDTTYTGYTSTQTINPQELNLWRVISLNDDGTVDIISEHLSSTSMCFRGLTGYRNFVGYLNILASKYENSDYTTGSRYFGYNGQTEYITADEDTYFSTSPPWTRSTGSSTVEEYGGGDELYTTDYDLINSVLGTTIATNPSGTSNSYWMASRYYLFSSYSWSWCGRQVLFTTGGITYGKFYSYSPSTLSEASSCAPIRPILTLKSGLNYSGLGTEDYPMEISAS